MKRLLALFLLCTASLFAQEGTPVKSIQGAGVPGGTVASKVGTEYIDISVTPNALYVCSALSIAAGPSPPAGTTTCTWTAVGGGSTSPSSLAVDATSSKYGLKWNTNWVLDATTTVGANPTVTCTTTNDCNFTSNDVLGRARARVGMITFEVCGPVNFTNIFTSSLNITQGTITTINGAQSITISGTASAACAANGVLVWGDDDSAALTSFWNDVTLECGRGLLPPGGMLVQSGQFNKDAAGSCATGNAIAGTFQGIALEGATDVATFIIPTPNFSFTAGAGNSCSGHGGSGNIGGLSPALNVCFFGSAGMSLMRLNLWGAGQNPANPAAQVWLAGISGGASSSNAVVQNVRVGSWFGGSSAANAHGFLFFNISVNGMTEFVADGLGSADTCTFDSFTGGSNDLFQTTITIEGGSFCGDSAIPGGTGTVMIGEASVSSHGNFWGFCKLGNSCSAVYIVGVGGIFESFGDIVGTGSGGSSAFATSAAATGAKLIIDGAIMNPGAQPATAYGIFLQAGSARVSKSIFHTGSAAGVNVNVCAACTYIDAGGNTYALNAGGNVTMNSGGTYIADGSSAGFACTGTVTASQTDGLYNHSTALNGTACATAAGDSIVMARPYTVYLVVTSASAGGVAGDVIKVYKNGVATASSAAIGTGTFAIDGAHSFTGSAGDRLGCEATTGAVDTLANPVCTFYWF